MIKGMATLVLTMLLAVTIQQARADSLVCKHNGQTLIYTEVKKADDPNGVGVVYLAGTLSKVIFHNGKEYRYGSIIPCVMIKEEVGKTKFLKEYQSQFE